jgi:hypothetical protein
MKKQYIFLAVLMVVLVLVGTKVTIDSRTSEKAPESTTQLNQPPGQVTNQPPKDQNSVQKGLRRFVLTSADKTITGDGTITLKDTLTSVGLRLTTAPKPPAGMVYEAYVLTGTQPPVFMGEMREGGSKLYKYYWAGAGLLDWYKADKVIVTKRKPAEPRPGQTIAEAKIGAEEPPPVQK